MGWLALLILEKGQCEGLTTGVSTEKQTPTSFLFPYILGLTAEFWGHRRHRFYFSLLMKKFLISLVMLLNLSVAGLFAQGSLIATLSHGDSIAMYYGNYALRDALNAAESGDVISLSGGSFTAVDINKAVSIRGAGIDVSLPTFINGEFKVSIPDNEEKRLSIEGIRSTATITFKGGQGCSSYISKCHLYALTFQGTSISANIINCYITNSIYSSDSPLCKVQLMNSFVSGMPDNRLSERSTFLFVNSILDVKNYRNGSFYTENGQFYNCIFFSSQESLQDLKSSNIALNCVSINAKDIFAANEANLGNHFSSFEELFKNFTGGNFENQKFELTDEAKAKFLGTDSTEVGWYGGAFPYTSIPSYPRITKMNVANKSTADGKLSVEIEVSAAK